MLVFIAVVAGSSGCQSLNQALGRRSAEEINQAQKNALGGMEALDQGRLDQAKSAFHEALEYTPENIRIRSHLAETHARSGEYEQAINQMLRVVESTHDPRHHVALGEMYLAHGQWLQAVRQADTALDGNRKLPEAWVLKGETHFAKGDFQSALACYQRALGLNPDLTAVQLRVAEAYRRRGEPLRSLATLEQLLSRFPRDQQPETALVAKGVALLEVQQLDEAIRLLEQASLRDRASVESFVWLGRAQFMAGRASDARTTFNRAQARFPNHLELEQIASQLQSQPGNQRVAWQNERPVAPLTRN